MRFQKGKKCDHPGSKVQMQATDIDETCSFSEKNTTQEQMKTIYWKTLTSCFDGFSLDEWMSEGFPRQNYTSGMQLPRSVQGDTALSYQQTFQCEKVQ